VSDTPSKGTGYTPGPDADRKTEAIREAYNDLEADQQAAIAAQCDALSKQVNRVGWLTALEILGKVAMRIVDDDATG
jgi:hypothetical protein